MGHCHHPDCIADAMARAEAACAARGTRLTDLRKQVLEIVWGSHKALTAADVMTALGDDKPPTTYRALAFLQENGLIHHVATLNAYVGCPQPDLPHVGQLLICGDCHDVLEIASATVQRGVENEAAKRHFTVHEQHVEVIGRCAACAGAHA